MKRGRASSSDDESGTEAEEHLISVSDYDLVDDDDTPVSFAALPIQWSDSENSDDVSTGKVFLQGLVDDGLRKFFTQVTAWRFDLSCTRPEIFLLSKGGKWIELQKPRKIFQDTIRTIMITIHFLHRVKSKCQMSAASVWQDLCKDKELSSYGVKPSQKDLLDHLPLIREASKRDAVLAKSKLLLMFLEKPKSQKLLDKEVNDVTRPELTVVGIDRDMIDEYNEELEEKDDLDVCAICDNGGNVTCCDGVCMRSFHATVESGRENNCVSLGFTQKEVDDIQSFYCKNCEYHQHQCFACGKLGSSDKVKGAEVIKCSSAACDRFYHPRCVAKLLSQVVKHVAEELERNITDGDPFTCPLHFCCVCKELENKRDPELQFAVCRRCPKSYHRKCLPREIAFGNEGIQRAWEGLLPNNRILIYCLNHEIDHELGTPVRDHIKFPSLKATVQKIKNTIEQRKPASKERAILKKKNVDFDNSSGKSTAKGSKLTGKLSSDKFCGKKSNKVISASNISRKPKSKETSRKCSTENNRSISKKFEMPDSEKNHNQPAVGEKHVRNPVRKLSIELPPLDADSEKSLLALFKEARSSITMESILEKHTYDSTHTQSLKNVVEKTITMEKLEDSVDAVRSALRKLESGCSIQDVKVDCDPDVLKQIFMWKDKLKIYLAPVLYGNRYTSYGRHFTHVEKLERIVDKLHWYVQNGDMIVDFCCGANDFSILMKKRLEETVKKCSYRNYDLLPTKNDFSFERRDWMTVQPTELPTGSQLIMGLRPPFGHKAALANKFIDKALEFKPKLIILIVPPETERLDKKPSPYDLIWEEENFLSSTSFYLPGSVEVNDTQVDQTNERPPLLSLWSRPDWTTKHKIIAQEHGHACSQNKVLETQSFDADIMLDANYAADDQASKKGQQRSSHCGNADEESQKGQQCRTGKSPRKRKHIEENNRKKVGSVPPAKRQALNKILEGGVNGRSSDEALQPKSTVACPRVEVAHDPSCGPLGSNNEQDVSETESSCKTNIPVIGQYEPRLCELKLVKSSLASETRPFSKSGRSSSSVPKPVYGGGIHAFAPALNCEYARQHSCGWLDE